MPKKLWKIQYPGELAEKYYYKAGQLLDKPLVCWTVDCVNKKCSKVKIVKFRGSCDYYSKDVSYAETENGSVLSSFYLFTQKPVLVKIKDERGSFNQWIAGSKKDIEKVRVEE